MPVTCNKDKAAIQKAVAARMERIHAAILHRLTYIGEKAVNEAKRSGNYKDQTGNLRSSIGFVISYNGSIVKWGEFSKAGKGTDGSDGVASGKQLAQEVGGDVKSGFCLTIVAGREYAQYVMDRGYNVLQSSELEARKEADKLVNKLKGL